MEEKQDNHEYENETVELSALGSKKEAKAIKLGKHSLTSNNHDEIGINKLSLNDYQELVSDADGSTNCSKNKQVKCKPQKSTLNMNIPSFSSKRILRRTASEPKLEYTDTLNNCDSLPVLNDPRKKSYEKDNNKDNDVEPAKLDKQIIRLIRSNREYKEKHQDLIDSPYNEIFFSKFEYLLKEYLKSYIPQISFD
jgi:hypothetical protein